MPYLQSFLMGLSFVAGILVATVVVLTLLRASAKQEKSESLASLLRLEEIHRSKVAELRRIADTLTAREKREHDRAFHGGQ